MSPLWNLRLPKLFNLRQDTFERADEISNTYWDCPLDHLPALYAAQALTAQQLASFGEFPPRQNQASFNLDSLLEKMRQATDGNLHKPKYLCLRSYGPQEPVLTDEWTPPQSNGWTESNRLLTLRSMPEI